MSTKGTTPVKSTKGKPTTTPNQKGAPSKEKGKKPGDKSSANGKAHHPQNEQLEEIKQKIKLILQECSEKITSFNKQIEQLDNDSELSYSNAQEKYVNDLDEAYNCKIEKIRSINEKYAYDLFKMKEYYDINDSYNVNSIIYDEVMKDKNAEIKEAEDEFESKKKNAKVKYDEMISKIKEESKKNRKEYYEKRIFEEIRQKIGELIKNPNMDDEESK